MINSPEKYLVQLFMNYFLKKYFEKKCFTYKIYFS